MASKACAQIRQAAANTPQFLPGTVQPGTQNDKVTFAGKNQDD